MKQAHTKVFEWVTWANLDKNKSVELILLRGHLLLEAFLDNLLENGGLRQYRESSFFKKACILSKLENADLKKVDVIQRHLITINKIRNELAHEWAFSVHSSELESWSKNVLADFEPEKFSKYTYRTKVIHAFLALTGALVEIQK